MGVMLQNSLAADPNRGMKSIYVWQAPVRIWHWVMTLAIFVLAPTGLLIAYPLPSLGGEASDHFLMGYIRFSHFLAGYLLAAAWLLRIYWAFVGNDYSRQLLIVPLHSGKWWKEFFNDLKTYAFLRSEDLRFAGHNPLAQVAMFFLATLTSLFMIATGFALYSEGTGKGSWADHVFGWIIPLFGQSQTVHTWHHLGMWVIVMFFLVHLYMVIRQDIVTKESIISTMVSGYRTFKD